MFQRDKDYVVKDDEVIIVDEFTGRLMPGRRWSDGLHQAVEAKEGVKIERENQTLATITFQNYFRMYKKLAGMTGTAETEAAEFEKIYKLDVTHDSDQPADASARNIQDVVYRTEEEKFRNAAKEIKELHEKGQPVLVGTVSVEKSEKLSKILKKMGVRHEVLNAKNHEREALHRRAGRAQRRGHRFDQHGRPRYRYSAGRQSGVHGARSVCARRTRIPTSCRPRSRIAERQEWDALFAEFKAQRRSRNTTKWSRWAACTFWAPNATNPGASTISFADAPARQGDPGSSRVSISRCKTI